jgi:hypothetical protein
VLLNNCFVSLQIPDLKDTEAVQRFFLQEVQLGEELLAAGGFCLDNF